MGPTSESHPCNSKLGWLAKAASWVSLECEDTSICRLAARCQLTDLAQPQGCSKRLYAGLCRMQALTTAHTVTHQLSASCQSISCCLSMTWRRQGLRGEGHQPCRLQTSYSVIVSARHQVRNQTCRNRILALQCRPDPSRHCHQP